MLSVNKMKYKDYYSEKLFDKLKKIKRKNKSLFDVTMKKIDEILEHPETYKLLSYNMKDFRRVHVLKSFVLIFKVDPKKKVVKFEDLDHHDKIYSKN